MDNHPFWQTAKTHVLGQLLILLSWTPGNSNKTPTAISASSLLPLSRVGTTSTALCLHRLSPEASGTGGMLLLKRVR